MTSKAVVLLTGLRDPHGDVVAEELRHRGVPVLRFDQADFPEKVCLSVTNGGGAGTDGLLTVNDRRTPFSEIVSLWRRRPTTYTVPEDKNLTPGEKQFLEQEAQKGIQGVFDAHVFSVSKRWAIRAANNKLVQLQRAEQYGLTVPRTLLTNDPAAIRPFYESCHGQMIVKPVQLGKVADDAKNERLIFTNLVTPAYLTDPLLQQVHTTAHLFQEAIPKAFDLRVVVIGQHIFGIEIHTPEGNHDFRTAYAEARYHVHALPAALAHKLLALVKSFHLQFSAMDLIVTPQGEYRWIELNPNGQFYWMQYQLETMAHERCPLKETMADLLAHPEEHSL